MHLQHSGTYVFGGKLPALASIGASATADAELIKKFKSGNPAQPSISQQPVQRGGTLPPPQRVGQVQPVIMNDPNLLSKFKKKIG